MIHIQVSETFVGKINEQTLSTAAGAALAHQQVEQNAELTIVIEDDPALQDLNHQFLGINAPTDVLSFPADEIDPDSGNPYLGDIIISLPRAVEQAGQAGHPLEAELQLLVVHGVLHLCGHDHAEPEEKTEMWQAQREILTGLGTRLLRWPD